MELGLAISLNSFTEIKDEVSLYELRNPIPDFDFYLNSG